MLQSQRYAFAWKGESLVTEQAIINEQAHAIPGFDAEVLPLLGVGLGLTGVALGLRPRLAPIPLALTALVAMLYRDPERTTPNDPGLLFAPADGTILSIDEMYEHRFLHTDAVRIATVLSPLDVPVHRSPSAGVVQYLEYVENEQSTVKRDDAAERNTRAYIGIEAPWGPLLITQIAGPLSPRISRRVEQGTTLEPGERLGTVRFGARVDLSIQRDSLELLIGVGQKIFAGLTPIARVIPL